jgi:HEAT repeat protein
LSNENKSLEDSIKNLNSQDVQIRKAAVENLGEYKEGIEPLINALKDENPDVRFQAACSLGNIGKWAVEPLLTALKSDEGGNIKKYAAFALKKIGDPSVTFDLIEVLNDKDFAVRKFAVKALGEIGDKKAVEPLIESLNDEDWGVRVATLKALGDIGDERAVDPIKKARRAAKGDKDFKKVANKALKKINK